MPALGRGGAGNIEAATLASSAQQRNDADDLDLERGHHEAYAGTPHDALHSQQYAHMGRGGAGNYYSPRALQATGAFEGAGTSHVLGDGTPEGRAVLAAAAAAKEPVVTGPVYRGRGGAGNYAFGVTESEERRSRKKYEEEEARKAAIRDGAEKGVDEGLAMPEKARLGGPEPY
ncbi:hypothetical protein MBLNU459_g2568t1 [Dothideomycetes sp. NU459]